ncbi:MAG: hypothetical protein ACRD5I_06140, partial [Candidatus Acidiferrales bacterium]
IAEELVLAGFADADGFIAEDNWLAATANHVYPDPLRRLWRAFGGLIRQPASVIVSLKDGYYTGSLWLNLFAWMQATHGSLRRAQSLGVVMSTSPALFPPDAPPFTGENILPRILQLQNTSPSPAAPLSRGPLGEPRDAAGDSDAAGAIHW